MDSSVQAKPSEKDRKRKDRSDKSDKTPLETQNICQPESDGKDFKDAKTSIANKSLQYPFSLTKAQTTWITEIRSRCMKTLEAIPPFGRRFSNTLTTVITHEKNWIKWKSESCPSFEREPIRFESKRRRLE
ncbi:UDP-glucose-4-epimerase, partial [Dinochytrium kinnereticum]